MQTSPSLASILLHENAVTQIAWHPRKPELLITSADSTVAAVSTWSPNSQPLIVRVPISPSKTAKYYVRWVASERQDRSAFWFWSVDEYVLGCLVEAEGGATFHVIYSLSTKT